MMKINMNNTNFSPSVLCYGLGGIGVNNTEQEAFELLDIFANYGGTFLDTARVYSDWASGETGRSERILGDYMHAHNNRNNFIISTKGAHPRLESMSVQRLLRDEIFSDLELSLKALKTDCIDIYFLHRDDPNRPMEEILQTLEECTKSGKIKEYGASNFSTERLSLAARISKKHGYKGFCASQIGYNIGVNHQKPYMGTDTMINMNDEIYEYHKHTEMSVMAYSAQAGGFFSKLSDFENHEELKKSLLYTPENLKIHEFLNKTCKETGMTIAQLIMLYLIKQEIQVFPIFSAYKQEQLVDVIKTLDYIDYNIDFSKMFL